MNNCQPFFFAVLDVCVVSFISLVYDGALKTAFRVYTADYAHECRLAGAIFTTERMYFTLFDFQVDIIQSPYAGEIFGQVLYFQYVFTHCLFLFVLV